MKNPLKHIKHIVKDPINTIAEADARKKEVMPLLYISLGILAVGLILQLALQLEFMVAISFIGLVCTVISVFLLWVIKKSKERFEGLTCKKCNTLAEIKTPEAFAKYVSYSVVEDKAIYKGYTGNKEPTNGVYSLVKYHATSSAIVKVAITCPNCGEVKTLVYTTEPFKCHAEASKVGALQFKAVSASLEMAVKTAVNDYNDPEKKYEIPYSLHSSKNPHFEERFTFKGANGAYAHPEYKGAKIDTHQDVEEMLEHYFVVPMINGTLKDPNKSKK